LAEIGGLTVLARMSELIESEAGCVKHRGNGRPLPWFARAATVADRWPGEGPWGGIITALDAAEGIDRGREWKVIVSCDMPFLTREWLSCRVQRALASDAEVIVPGVGARAGAPLCVLADFGARQSDRRYDTLAH
jgi:molybdopterin-guanine dinucleotide biosynthesis protein A